jgi:hypothetical protein
LKARHLLLVTVATLQLSIPLCAVPSLPAFIPAIRSLPDRCASQVKSLAQPEFAKGTNDVEIVFFSIMRSGHHAVIDWVRRQTTQPVVNLNCCIYYNSVSFDAWNMTKRKQLNKSDSNFAGGGLFYHGTNAEPQAFAHIEGRERLEDIVDNARSWEAHNWRQAQIAEHRGQYLWNLENFPLNRLATIPWQKAARGNSKRHVFVVIIRDPYNLFASRMRGEFPVDSKSFVLWKQYAKAYLYFLKHPKPGIVFINFNRWLTDSEYRQQLAVELGYATDITRIEDIRGTGSSFTGKTAYSQSQISELSERWKIYEHNAAFRNLFDKETKELSRKIFGINPF